MQGSQLHRSLDGSAVETLRRLFVGRDDAYLEERRGCVKQPLTDAVLNEHLAGYRRVGAYSLLADGSSARAKFLCLDFDGKHESDGARITWEAAKTSRETLATLALPSYVEVSRSGRGYHVWVFLEEPLPLLEDVQQLGALVLRLSGLSPKTEVFPKGSVEQQFGCTPFLPLHGYASGERRTSVFVDEHGRPYGDQYGFLESVECVERSAVSEALVMAEGRLQPAPVPAPYPRPVAVASQWIPEGRRNVTLTSLAGALRRRGTAEETILSALRAENAARCSPPLPDRELVQIARSIGRYAPSVQPVSAPVGETKSRSDDSVLVPGKHVLGEGLEREVSTYSFADAVLSSLPAGVLYRRDSLVGELQGPAGERTFRELSVDGARMRVDAHVRLAKWRAGKGDGKPVDDFVTITRNHAALVLEGAAFSPKVRDLKLLAPHPVVVGRDYRVAQPGWDEESGVFYDEPPELEGLTPAELEPGQAKEFLDDLVVDFPLRDEASRHNLYGLLLTVALRPALRSTVPLHLVHASLERTGKGMLIASLLGEGIQGKPLPSLQLGSSEEEREKRVTGLLLEGTNLVHLDNLPTGRVLDSASLCALLTNPVWKGRVLGRSNMPRLPNVMTLVASANNVRTTGEIAKRIVPIVLQPRTARPEERDDFVHPDALAYVRSRRRELWAVLLGMVEEWKRQGRPDSVMRMGGFESWARTVGGVLEANGFDQWLGNYRSWANGADDWSADAETLVGEWHRRYGGMLVTARQILEMVQDTETFPSVTARREEGQPVSLARSVLTPLTDRPVGEHVVVRERHGGSSRYRLEPATAEAAA